jgi:MarR family 2-MHQ and catechol resistance regulon transcriptional repressor
MGTRYKGSLEEINALNTYIKLFRASESVRSRLYLKLAEEGLTESQFYLLDVLYHLGPSNQKDISKKIFKSEGNVTMIINNLEKQKLVKKKKSKDDGRVYIINLTDEGKNLYENFFPIFLKSILSEFSELNGKDIKRFQKICRRIGLNTGA